MDRCNYTINPDNTLTGSGAVNVVPNNSSSVSNSAHQASPSLLFSQHGLMRQTYGLSTCETMNYPYVESFQQNESNRRRRIEEALSFLDQVKSQFSTAPKVYSDFLDIMRDFKSQTIDTPGVIRRVSKLFRGRPNLIVGFNPFLPPGFELRVEGSRIIICEPSGKTQLVDEGIRELPVTPRTSCSPSVAPVPPQSGDKPGSVVVSNVPETNVVKIQDQPVTSISPPNASSLSSSHSLHHTPPEQSSAEINQAINYVNKIKARFHDRPDVYKQFLEILHSYQQEQQSGHHQGDSNMITEKQVYSSVAALFESEPDLLREFSQFLPDACGILNKPSPVSADKSFPYCTDQVAKLKICRSAVGTVDRAAMVISPQPVCVPKVSPSQTCSMKVSSSPPLTPTLSSSTGSGLTNPPIPPTLPISSFVPTSTLSSSSPCHTPVTCLPATSTVFCPSKSRSPPRNIQQKRVFSPLRSAAKKAKLNSSDVIVYDVELSEAKKYATAEEYLFFDKVRKLLTDEIIFDNFLRCIVLYNQSIISKNELLELVQPFLEKDAELMKFFRGMLGMNDIQTTSDVCDDVSDSGPQDRGMSDLALQIDYATCKRLGVSYRSLPDNYIRPKCSGRTALCHSVLNDTWVSFPSWSSEDTSCVHSKKSQYEEFIYRTEDERYELDIVIEVNKSALETLEMINRKMQRMKPEDANKFKLDANIGSSSPSLMYRAVKRIYGEHVHKILNGLRKNPAVVVPKVIERMRMKEREWREAQVQFNRIWREQNEKYFAKSLDHQGLTFKQTDTKNLRSKMIIHHFETLYDERESRMEEGGPPEWGPHGIFDYPDDMSVLYDVNDLVIHYVKRQQNMQKEEKRQAKRCLKRLLPELFNLPPQEMSDQEDSEDCGSSEKGEVEGEKSRPRRGRPPSKLSIEVKEEIEDNETNKEKGIDLRPDPGLSYRLFYGANAWCVFLKLHQTLCERLARMKRKTSEMLEDYKMEERLRCEEEKKIGTRKMSGAENSSFCDGEKGLNLLKKDVQNPSSFYRSLIKEVKNLLDGLIEPATFEDNVRNMFGTEAYITFTMDKIVSTMGRQLQAMTTEEVNIGTFELYQKFRFDKPLNMYEKTENESRIEAAYETASEQLLANQNCFKTFFIHGKNKVTVELIDSDTIEENSEHDNEALPKWNHYVQHFMKSLCEDASSLSADEQQHFAEILAEKPVFLMRNVRVVMEHNKGYEEESKQQENSRREDSVSGEKEQPLIVREDLHVHFTSSNNYRMQFVAGSSDVLIRYGAAQRGMKKHKLVVARRKERFTSWLELHRYDEGSDLLGTPRNWLSDGSKIIPVRHPKLPYLIYNRYVSTASDDCRSSSISTTHS